VLSDTSGKFTVVPAGGRDAADLRRDRVSGASATNAYLPDGPLGVAHPTSHFNC
jgi:hypothetical protein